MNRFFRRATALIGAFSLVTLFAGLISATVFAASGTFSFSGFPVASHNVNLIAGDQVTATLECAGGSALDPWLYVYSPSGGLVAENDDGNYGGPGCDMYMGNESRLNSRVTFTAITTGSYRFEANVFGGNGAYTLTVTVAGASDTDGDGVANSSDNCSSIPNPSQENTDGDAQGNVCDATPNGDTDGDGIDNLADACPDWNDAQDTDSDGIPNGCDNTPNGDDDGDGVDNFADTCPGYDDHADADGDGKPDNCDTTPTGDVDGDGVDNATDNCPGVSNVGQEDVDTDSKGDACDGTPNGDDDGDGVDNNADNCPTVANSGQGDTDGDGKGNSCDATRSGDSDSDGVENALDNCPTMRNTDQKNEDGDAEGNVCDAVPQSGYHEAPFNPGDARINQHPKDRGASAAVYCTSAGINIWRIDDQGEGHEALVVTTAEVEAVGIPTEAEHHFEIAQADVPLGRITLYSLWTGEFQVNAPGVRADAPEYIFIWRECATSK